jgi:cyclic pyranopterin phosphate synthase
MTKLSHLDEQGRAAMVDVSAKGDTERLASAQAIVLLSADAYGLVVSGEAPKGDVLATARIAGIMAAKKTSELIPLCHPLALSHAAIAFEPIADRHAIAITASVKTTGPTGVEMEALTAASVAALTVYDMVKAVDRSARIESIRVLTKSGGKTGTYEADAKAEPAPVPSSSKTRPRPSVLVHEATAPRPTAEVTSERAALRDFMAAKRLRASAWAKSAEVPVSELYAFLNGRARSIAPASAEKLARAAKAQVDDLFGRRARG